MGTRIDLHTHTKCSDGAFFPKEVIDEAVKNGVNYLAIADHDTVEAYNDELFKYAEEKNIKLIRAVEISTKANKAGVHVLGYNIDIENQELLKKLSALRNARHDYLHNVATKLQELGYVINVEELDKVDAVTKAHIALDVINNPKNKGLLLNNFENIPAKGEFIETVMNEGCPAYVKKETITPKEAAELIRKAGGKVILAHPVAYKYEDNLSEDDIWEIVQQMKADGIEANYVYIDRKKNRRNEAKEWNEFAKKHNLMVTKGSDFHVKDDIHPKLGLINEDLDIDEDEIIRKLLS